MNMLDTLKSLYLQGRLDGGLFRKTAQLIINRELQKLEKTANPQFTQSFLGDIGRTLASMADPEKVTKYFSDLNLAGAPRDFLESVEKMRADRIRQLVPDPGTAAHYLQRIGKYIPPKIALTAAALAGIGLLSKIKDKYDEHKEDKLQNAIFNQTLSANPELDKLKATRNFQSLKTVAPTMASDPAMAEGFLRRMNEFDMLDIAPVQMISQIQKNVADAESRSHQGEGITGALSDLGASLAAMFV